jgi:hypothetical protein
VNTIPPPAGAARTPVPVGSIQVRDWDREAAPISVRTASKLLTSTPMRPTEIRSVPETRPSGEVSEKPSGEGGQPTPAGPRAATFVPSTTSTPPPAMPAGSAPASPASPSSGEES